jgi:hypothetical protein
MGVWGNRELNCTGAKLMYSCTAVSSRVDLLLQEDAAMSGRTKTSTASPAPPKDARSARATTVFVELEKPIQTVIEATNRGDTPELLNAFADDAVLIDSGRTFAGKEEITRWNAEENIGTKNRLHVTDVRRAGYEVKVDVVVSGHGYNGPGVLSFLIDGDVVKRLLIT